MIPEARLQEIKQRARSHNMSDGEYARHLFGLVAEVRRLREELAGISERCESWDEPVNDLWVARLGERARAALTEESEER